MLFTKKLNIIYLFLFLLSALPSISWGWGSRGHSTICEAAVFLLKEKNLKNYLENKPQMMGHLCNIPDTYWRSLGPESSQLGNPTHFVEPQILGIKIKDTPLDFQKIVDEYTGKINLFKQSPIFSIPAELGSNWWRADQFYRRAISVREELSKAAIPTNKAEEQNDKLPFNALIYNFVVNIGLMGHFVGDNSQPLHVTPDYDGYAAGHGGIHSFYEDTLVAHFDGDLTALVLKKARSLKNQSYLKPDSVVEKMRALAVLSDKELEVVFKYDVVDKKSELKKEKGMEIKTPAVRTQLEKSFKKLSPVILEQLARSSLLLAQLWDKAYVEAGAPLIHKNKSYRYPLTPDFVAPDYFKLPTGSTPKSKTE
ncbi:MAG: hypothetical protein ACOYOK_06295 [Pseudobdellovibrionaceae bacterium]